MLRPGSWSRKYPKNIYRSREVFQGTFYNVGVFRIFGRGDLIYRIKLIFESSDPNRKSVEKFLHVLAGGFVREVSRRVE